MPSSGSSGIISCRVIVERREPRQQGNVYQIRIDLSVPGCEIVVGRDTKAHHAHQDVHAAIRDAFDAARRQLEDNARDRCGEVKLHSVPDHGRIARFLPEKDCGFIVSPDGSEIYFSSQQRRCRHVLISSRLVTRCASSRKRRRA